jgi:hypothetical protein
MQAVFVATLALTAVAASANRLKQGATVWHCTELNSSTIVTGATWQQLNCSSPGVPFFGPAGPVMVNVVTADLSQPHLRLVASVAPPSLGLAPLNTIASSDGRNLIAGVNGGYFYRLDVSSFFDGVCICKDATDAKQPVNASSPNFGIGDGLTISRGKLLATNCDCLCCFNKPTVFTANGTFSRIDVVSQGGAPPFGLGYETVTAGPFLLETNASGTFVAIPQDDENIFNVLEHSANTGVGLDGGGSAFFVTFDGYDGCGVTDPTCGTNAYTMAYFFMDYLHATTAMGMDQGGSTTMYVAGKGSAGIVSNPGSAPRHVYNGLFLEAVPPSDSE